MKKQNGFIKILLAVIILILIITAYVIYSKKSDDVESLSSVNHNNSSSASSPYPMKELTREEDLSIGMANWKTYKNDKYGFEMKYPAGWTLRTDENSAGGTDYLYTGFVNPENNYTFFINVLKRDTPDDSIDKIGGMGYRKDYINIIEADKIVRTVLPRQGDGEGDSGFEFELGRMKSVRAKPGLSEGDPWDSEINQAVFINDKFGYIIGYGIGEDSDKNWNKGTIEKMDEMVRTFRLTK